MESSRRKLWTRSESRFFYRLYRSKIFTVLFSFLTFYLIHSVIQEVYETKGRVLKNTWMMHPADTTDQFSIQKIPFYRLSEKPETIRMQQIVSYHAGDYIVFPRISGNRMKLFIEKHEISALGGVSETGNIWTGFFWISLPDEYAENDVTLEIELHGVYDLGIREIPYFISGKDSQLFRFFTQFIFMNLYWIVTGILMILAVIQILYAFIDRNLQISYLLNTLGTILGAIYLMEYTVRSDSGDLDTYLLIRKLLFLSGLIAPWCFLAGMEFYTYGKFRFSLYMIGLTSISIILILLPDTHHEFKRISVWAASLAHLNWLILFLIALKNKNHMIIFSVAFFHFSLLSSLFSILFHSTHIFMLQIGYMFANISIAYNLMEEFGRIHADYQKVYKKSLLDPLTGAYNRYVLDEMIFDPEDIVILADMNNFKMINDKYGHQAGDRVLIEWVSIVRSNIREEDLVVRLGGDEFAIILKGTKEDIMENIAAEFANRLEDLPVSFSYGIEKAGNSITNAIREADSKMYMNKDKKKSLSWFEKIFS